MYAERNLLHVLWRISSTLLCTTKPNGIRSFLFGLSNSDNSCFWVPTVYTEASLEDKRGRNLAPEMLCVGEIFRSHQVQELGRKTFPGHCSFIPFLVFFLLCGSCWKAEDTLTMYLSLIPPSGAGWQLFGGDHTHNGNHRCSMDFKQTWNRVLAVMALSGPTFYYIPQSWQRWLESTSGWFYGLDYV